MIKAQIIKHVWVTEDDETADVFTEQLAELARQEVGFILTHSPPNGWILNWQEEPSAQEDG